ncbi:DUF4102 domain-containing protein [Pseudomonas sp. BN417]|uniref:tyrosine-type recombinase/integrase n=1 Tax=Pseudomonas sp. BN417 TaxID=2567890 RepID=UPI002453DB52|nr:integrase arm-type DNA-binding domain-containing protein [Pseudomonas sp. BN417]MDH4557972.1 DUF4102 domain-containing protein [Pseudomonas sp. BN417]
MSSARGTLTDAKIGKLSEPGKKHSDGTVGGLYLEVTKAGNRLWRLKYRMDGAEGRYAIGAWPEIGVTEARRIATEARAGIARGVKPVDARNAQKAAQEAEKARTFRAVAEQWLGRERGRLVERSITGFEQALTKHVYPALGDMQVATIRLEHIAGVIRKLEAEGITSMAKRVRTIIRAVLGYAQGLGWVESNAADVRGGALRIEHRTESYAALETPDELQRFLCTLYAAEDSVVTRALKLLFILAPRPGELATMRWEDLSDLDAESPEWRYTPGKTAHRERGKHVVPLPPQAVEILRAQHSQRVVDSKGRGWVFPSPRRPGLPLTGDSLLKAIRRLGFESTAHGARACFRSIAHEHLGADWVVLELHLSHRMPGPLGAAYARAQLLPQRREVVQRWACYLDELRAKGQAA